MLQNATDSPDMWRWVVGLYVAKPSTAVRESQEGQTGTQSGYSFLCTAVFVHPVWAVVPAHCILNPETYTRLTSQSTESNGQEETTENVGLAGTSFLQNRPGLMAGAGFLVLTRDA